MVITSPLHTVIDFHNHVLCRVKKRVGRPLFCIFECVLLAILVGDLREMHGKWTIICFSLKKFFLALLVITIDKCSDILDNR